MPHRRLVELLERYIEHYPEDLVRADHVRQFVRVHPDCFHRTCFEGHITASAWILSPDHRQVLLVEHRKLQRWLQPGGHADGDTDTFRVALREVQEESGLTQLAPLEGVTPELPFDIDVHRIPARPGEPAHLHHDLRYVFVTAPGQTLRLSDESTALRWVERDRLAEFSTEESILRMERKTCVLFSLSPRRLETNS